MHITLQAAKETTKYDLVAAGHDTGHTLYINLLSDIPCLDDLFLAADSHQPIPLSRPAVLLQPVGHTGLLHQAQQLPQHPLLYGLVGDADHMTDKPPYRILKSLDRLDELTLVVNLLPEYLELTHLQQVCQVQDVLDLDKLHCLNRT